MARVLIVSALQVFPPLSGGNRRTAMLAEGLAAHGHAVRVYSLIGRKADMIKGAGAGTTTQQANLEEYVERPKATWLKAMAAYRLSLPPLWAGQAMLQPSERLRRDVSWAEVVVFDFPFVSFPTDAAKVTILNTHNVEVKLFGGSRWREQLVLPRVALIEEQALSRADLVCCSSQEEITTFSRILPQKTYVHVPNCVDHRRFQDLQRLRAQVRQELGLAPEVRALFFPASVYGPNRAGFEYLREFAATNHALLNALNVTFVVTGSVTKTPLLLPRLIATGPVPRIEPYFAAADWGVNPIFQGSGTSIKVAEMIAAGLPLLTTVVGARGFDLEDGAGAVYFTRETFANQLAALPRDLATRQSLATTAARKNASYLEPTAALEPLSRLLQEVAGRRAAAS